LIPERHHHGNVSGDNPKQRLETNLLLGLQ